VRSALIGTFADWEHSPEFPRALAEAADARGAVLVVSWEPWDSWTGQRDQPAYALRSIIAGAHDALIDRWARQIAEYGRPVLVRFAAEMNGDWLPWSTAANGNRPGDYVAAWRHARSRFARSRASNARWVWNPIATYDGATPLRAVFPGAQHVDWTAIDGYNWGSTRQWGWQSYSEIFSATIAALRRLAARRPLMIAEIGCAPDPRKGSWVADALNRAHLDDVAALMWFEFAKETDWRLSSSAAASACARAILRPEKWQLGGDLAAVDRAITGDERPTRGRLGAPHRVDGAS
jgi:beta-mannanase